MSSRTTSTGTTMTDRPEDSRDLRRAAKVGDVVDGLTGHDELRIEQYFGAQIDALEGAKYMRALAFALLMHEGKTPKEAHAFVLDAKQSQIGEFFDVADDEADDQKGDDDGADQSGAGAEPADPAGGDGQGGGGEDPGPGTARPGGTRSVTDAPQA